MCIAIPMQVVSSDGLSACCRNGPEEVRVNTELTGRAQPGDWLLVFQGSAVRPMEQSEALQMRAALGALSSVMEGTATREDIDAAFADITAHTGELPDFLKPRARGS